MTLQEWKKYKVLSIKDVLDNGIEWDDDVDATTCYPVLLYVKNSEGEKVFLNGIVYEKYGDDDISYYSEYVDGEPQGLHVKFDYDTNIPIELYEMKYGTSWEHTLTFHEGGILKEIEYVKFGRALENKKYDCKGRITGYMNRIEMHRAFIEREEKHIRDEEEIKHK